MLHKRNIKISERKKNTPLPDFNQYLSMVKKCAEDLDRQTGGRLEKEEFETTLMFLLQHRN